MLKLPGKISFSSEWLRQGFLALAGGLMCACAFPNPFGIHLTWPGGFLAFFSLIPLALIHATSLARYAGWGFFFGFIYFGVSLVWLAVMPALGPLGPGVWLILTAYLACYPAVFMLLYHLMLRRGLPAWGIAPALWVALEYIRNYMVSGFPWVALGYAHHQNPYLMALVPFGGVWGLSFLSVFINFGLVAGLRRFLVKSGGEDKVTIARPILWGQGLVTLFLVLALILGGYLEQRRLHAVQDQAQITVAALQGNIDQNQPWDGPYRRTTLDRFHALGNGAIAQNAELLIWPESSFPGIFNWDHTLANEVKLWSRQWNTQQIVASDTVDIIERGEYRYFNSMLWINLEGMVTGRISKMHLVPFGEYIPFKRTLLFFIRKMVPRYENGEFTPGTQRIPLVGRFAGHPAAVGGLICFESIFPQYASELVQQGSQLLVVVTYDAWFGATAAPAQHAIFSAFRAAETNRYLVRTAATGISCVYDPYGRLLGFLPLNHADILVKRLGLRTTLTRYVQWGPWVAWLCLAWTLLGLAWIARRPRPIHTKTP